MTNDKKISKQMSFWLRHRPEDAGLKLSEAGWADVTALLAALGEKGIECDLGRLRDIVTRNDKKRFEFPMAVGLFEPGRDTRLTSISTWFRCFHRTFRFMGLRNGI